MSYAYVRSPNRLHLVAPMTESDDLDAPIARIERQLDDLSRAVDSLADLLISLRDSLAEDDRTTQDRGDGWD